MKFKIWLTEQDTVQYVNNANDKASMSAVLSIIGKYIDSKLYQRNQLNSNQALSGMSGTPNYMSPEMIARAMNPQYTRNLDMVEQMCFSLVYAVPFRKQSIERVWQNWLNFRNEIYKRLNEAVNPVIYDVAIQRIEYLDRVLLQINNLLQNKNNKESLLFKEFYKNYRATIPNITSLIKNLQKNTPRT